MNSYEQFWKRHGEHGVQAIVEEIERHAGIVVTIEQSLEERWNRLMAQMVVERTIPKWTVQHFSDRSEIYHKEPFAEKRLMLTIMRYPDNPAPALSKFVMTVLNSIAQNEEILEESKELVETLLSEGHNFTTENAAEHLQNRFNGRPLRACAG